MGSETNHVSSKDKDREREGEKDTTIQLAVSQQGR